MQSTSGMSWEDFKKVMNEDLTEHGWKKKSETKEKDFAKKGFKYTVFQRKQSSNKGVDVVRVEAEMKDVEPKLIMHYFLNPPKDSMIKEMRQLHVAPNGDTTVYWRLSMPMMSDRDNVVVFRQQELKDEGGIFVQFMNVDSDVPVVKGVIRMEQ